MVSALHNCNKGFNIQNDGGWEGQAEGEKQEDGCWQIFSASEWLVKPCWSQWDWFGVGLACGGKDCQTPFQQLFLKQSDFILLKYLPLDTTLDSPWMMHCENMVKVFKYIAVCQASHGVQDTFRFKAVLSSHKKGSLHLACYFDLNVEQVSPALEVTNTNSQREKGGRHWKIHKAAEQMLWGAPYLFTTIPSQPNVGRGLSRDPASLEGYLANQCPMLILASTYPPSSVGVSRYTLGVGYGLWPHHRTMQDIQSYHPPQWRVIQHSTGNK